MENAMKRIQKVNGLRIGMIQMSSIDNPIDAANAFIAKAKQLARRGVDIIVGSEMQLTHYVSGDRYELDEFISEMYQAHQMILVASKEIDAVLIYGGIGLSHVSSDVGEDGRQRKYNAAFVVQNGVQIKNDAGLPFAIKVLHPNYRIFDDARHFFCLRKLAMEMGVQLSDLLKPFTVTIRGRQVKLGVLLCEDAWHDDYAQKPAIILAQNGADILFDLSCSNWSWQKNRKRDQVIGDICRQTGLWCVYVNNVGVQNNGKNFITFDGASTIYNPGGEIVAMYRLYEDQASVVKLLDSLRPKKRTEVEDVEQMFTAVAVATKAFIATLPQRLRKCIIAVSGGKDSSAALALMVHLLGAENVLAVTMPMDGYTSAETKNDAVVLCEALGVECLVVPIGAMVEVKAAAIGAVPESGPYKTVQAIERMSTLAGLGAAKGYFFTSNANMTESAFGYGTLNADLRGVFAPWGNCLAQDVYRILDFMNQTIFDGKIPQSIIDRAPSDELSSDQSPDPFHYGHVGYNGYHDQMVRAIVAFRRGKEWFVDRYVDGTLEQEMQLPKGVIDDHFPTAELWLEDLNRCFKLYHAAFFKRVQSVPCPLVDKRSFGWDLREPILAEVETTRFRRLVCQYFTQKIGVDEFELI